MKKCAALAAIFLIASPAQADYVRTGEMSATVCSGFIIKSCSFPRVDAVDPGNGTLTYLPKIFKEVDEYRGGKEPRCWIQVRSSGLGLLDYAADNLIAKFKPKFFHKDVSGEYQEIDVDGSIAFPCIKQ